MFMIFLYLCGTVYDLFWQLKKLLKKRKGKKLEIKK